MSSSNPLHILSLPILLTLAIPFAFFATLTTASAFTILFLRLTIIYTELGMETIPKYLFGPPRPTKIIPLVFQDGPFAPSASSRFSLSSALSSTVSFADKQGRERFTCKRRKTSLPTQKRPSMFIDTNSKINPSAPFAFPHPTAPPGQRDFEGLGGWRSDSDDENTAVLTSLKPRLELPGSRKSTRSIDFLAPPSHRYRSITSGHMQHTSHDSVLPLNKKKRHFSTSSFDLKYSGSPGVGMFHRNAPGRVRSNSSKDPPSLPKDSKATTPALLSVNPLTSPEINRRGSKRARSRSDNSFPRLAGVENAMELDVGISLSVKKRASAASEAGRRHGSSPDSKRSSGTEETLKMKMR